jgi:molybdopterin converting factor small subunit
LDIKDENGNKGKTNMTTDVPYPRVEVTLFGSFRRYLKGRKSLTFQAADIKDIIKGLPIDRGEVGLVLVNKKAVESLLIVPCPLKDGDLVEIYPIVTGG